MDKQQIFDLLEAGDVDQALPHLQEYLEGEATEEEKGQVLALLARAHIRLTTEVNKAESAALESIADSLEELEKGEKDLADASGLAEARSALE